MKKCYYEVPTFKLYRGSWGATLNFQGGPGVRLLNFRGLPSPILNFVGGVLGPGSESSVVPCPGS